jgi:hypothetical protein
MATHLLVVTWQKAPTTNAAHNGVLDKDFEAVLRLAREIDHEEERLRDWYLTAKISELGGKTAQELVQAGDVGLVIGFLRSIGRGYRD